MITLFGITGAVVAGVMLLARGYGGSRRRVYSAAIVSGLLGAGGLIVTQQIWGPDRSPYLSAVFLTMLIAATIGTTYLTNATWRGLVLDDALGVMGVGLIVIVGASWVFQYDRPPSVSLAMAEATFVTVNFRLSFHLARARWTESRTEAGLLLTYQGLFVLAQTAHLIVEITQSEAADLAFLLLSNLAACVVTAQFLIRARRGSPTPRRGPIRLRASYAHYAVLLSAFVITAGAFVSRPSAVGLLGTILLLGCIAATAGRTIVTLKQHENLIIDHENRTQHLRTIANTSSDTLMLYDPSAQQLSYVSPAALRILGIPSDQVTAASLPQALHLDEAVLQQAMRATLSGGQPQTLMSGHHDLIIETLLSNMDGTIVLSVRDVTAREQRRKALHDNAFRDSLTGLMNRNGVLLAVETALAEATTPVSVLYIDLSRFKHVNDAHGHAVGDEVLRYAAQRITGIVADSGSVGRLGGDEFTVVVTDPTIDLAELALTVSAAMQQPFIVGSNTYQLGAALGSATYNGVGTAADLLRCADVAMYAAKRRGVRYLPHTSELSEFAHTQTVMDADAAAALRDNTAYVIAQRVVRLDGRGDFTIKLAPRWHDRHGVEHSSASLRKYCETAGLSTDLAWVLLDETIRLGIANPHVARMSVSIPQAILLVKQFPQRLHALMHRYNFDPNRLVIQVAEHRDVAKAEDDNGALTQLANYGIKVSLREFGSGYSSLEYLLDTPLHAVVLDRALSNAVTTSAKARSAVAALIAVARDRDIAVVAEGVDDLANLEVLAALGCTAAQGSVIDQGSVVIGSFGWAQPAHAGA